MPKVSVIVPIYGVETYIAKCAVSLFEQTLDDIEYLFIDDCTPDHSIEVLTNVLSHYPKRVSNVHILKMERNSGQAAVRKYGISQAQGEYVAFCDSDDWIEHTMYEQMYLHAQKDNYDIVVCDFCSLDGEKTIVHRGAYSTAKQQFLSDMLIQKCNWSLCNKIVRRSLYKESIKKYPVSNLGEDMALVFQLSIACRKIGYIGTPFYYYYQNPRSITKVISKEALKEKYCQFQSNLQIVENVFAAYSLVEEFSDELVALKFFGLTKLWPIIKLDSRFYSIWNAEAKSIIKKVLFNQYIGRRKKFKFYLTFIRLYP